MKAYIVKGFRTAVGKAPRGIFRFTRPDDLAAATVKHLVSTLPELDVNRIDDVIVGNATPEAEQGLNIGRMVSLMGLNTDKVPGVTVNRYCSSGLETIALATAKINAGMADCIIAGGEKPCRPFHLADGALFPMQKYLQKTQVGIGAWETLQRRVARRYNISRASQDEFALTHTKKH